MEFNAGTSRQGLCGYSGENWPDEARQLARRAAELRGETWTGGSHLNLFSENSAETQKEARTAQDESKTARAEGGTEASDENLSMPLKMSEVVGMMVKNYDNETTGPILPTPRYAVASMRSIRKTHKERTRDETTNGMPLLLEDRDMPASTHWRRSNLISSLLTVAISLAGCHAENSEREDAPPGFGRENGSAVEGATPPNALTEPMPSDQVESGPHDEILLSGVIRSVDIDSIRVQADTQTLYLAEEMTFQLTQETEITVGGAPAKRENLAPQMRVTVTAHRENDMPVAARIDASRDSEQSP